MSRIVIVPDTNLFLNYPDFISFLVQLKRLFIWIFFGLCYVSSIDTATAIYQRQDLQEKGRKADQAIKLVRKLLENADENLELEIYRPESLNTSPADAQIVDCIVELASQYHPDDKIEFVTDDEGIPTVLFIQETKRQGLTNGAIKTAREVQQQVSLYGAPMARIERIRINPLPFTVANERGVELFVDFLLSDMKGQTAQVGVYADGKQQPLRYRDLPITPRFLRNIAQAFSSHMPYSELYPGVMVCCALN